MSAKLWGGGGEAEGGGREESSGGARERVNEVVGRGILWRGCWVEMLEGGRRQGWCTARCSGCSCGGVGGGVCGGGAGRAGSCGYSVGAIGNAATCCAFFSCQWRAYCWDTAVVLLIGNCGAHSCLEVALECLLASSRRSALRSFGKRRGQLRLWEWGRWTLHRRH